MSKTEYTGIVFNEIQWAEGDGMIDIEVFREKYGHGLGFDYDFTNHSGRLVCGLAETIAMLPPDGLSAELCCNLDPGCNEIIVLSNWPGTDFGYALLRNKKGRFVKKRISNADLLNGRFYDPRG